VVNLVGFLIVPLHHLLMDVLRRFIAHASESALLLFKTVAIHRYYPSVTFRFPTVPFPGSGFDRRQSRR
jgi:hypothetical protein